MKNLFTFTFIVFAVCSCFAQVKSGKITYRVTSDSTSYIDSLANDPNTSQHILEVNKRDVSEAKPVNYFLIFNNKASIFIPEYDISEMRRLKLGMNYTAFITKFDFKFYTDRKTNEVYGQSTFVDRVNILYDDIHWTLTQETKQIGAYTCYKAITFVSEEQDYGYNHTKPITAWYTPQIPVSFGIQEFSGLPGLILEMDMGIQYGDIHFEAVKIELNIDSNDKIENNKGKVISEAEYVKLIKELNANR